jgi:phage tail sheath protein FI
MTTINITQFLSPGVYILEDTDGYIPVEIATFSNVYMVGTSASGAVNTPTQVVSPEDFTNQFGASKSLPYVKMYFSNDPNGILSFVRVNANAPATEVASEFVATIGAAFNEDQPQGFLISPQAFQYLSNANDRLSVATKMKDIAEDENFDWIDIADASFSADTVSELQTEGTSYVSAAGHTAYYAPWVVSLDDETMPPSPVVAGVATRRYRNQGFYQPPAGLRYPIRGVKALTKYFTRSEHDSLNPLGINLLKRHSNGSLSVWGSRTRSTNEYFRFINQRVTFNVVKRTLREAFDILVFDLIDGQGLTFRRIKDTAEQILYRIWQTGALYGATPGDSFLVVCDETNNPALDIEAGIVRFDAYLIPSSPAERIVGRVVRVPIGTFSVALNQ